MKRIRLQALVDRVSEASGGPVTQSAAVASLFKDEASMAQEGFWVLLLNQKNVVIEKRLVSLGTLSASLVHPREVFRPAIMQAAARVILVHNHPSGDFCPSQQDRLLTERLAEAGKLIGIDVLDHVIISTQGSFSFAEQEGIR